MNATEERKQIIKNVLSDLQLALGELLLAKAALGDSKEFTAQYVAVKNMIESIHAMIEYFECER